MKITRYGLFHKKEKRLLTFDVSPNNCAVNIHCYDMQYALTTDDTWGREGSIWLVEDHETAEQARITDTGWWNANYSTPSNEFMPDELEVVQIEMVLSKKE